MLAAIWVTPILCFVAVLLWHDYVIRPSLLWQNDCVPISNALAWWPWSPWNILAASRIPAEFCLAVGVNAFMRGLLRKQLSFVIAGGAIAVSSSVLFLATDYSWLSD